MPSVVAGSILVKVSACSICGSDLRISKHGHARVQTPRIIGHEISGAVVAVGEGVEGFAEGDFLSVGADIPCGECDFCKNGRPNCCHINYAMGYQFDGGFAEYVLLNHLVTNGGPVQKFGHGLSFEAAALAEPLACCINGFEQAMMQPGNSVLVFGAGPIGLMLCVLAKQRYSASKVIVVEPSAFRRKTALDFGADHVVDPLQGLVVEQILSLTAGLGADTIFTANPVAATHEWAIASVAKRGVVNLFGGLPSSDAAVFLPSNHIHYREAYVTGSHGSSPRQHRDALVLIESGVVDAESFVTHRFHLDAVNEGFAMARSRNAIKVVILPNGATA